MTTLCIISALTIAANSSILNAESVKNANNAIGTSELVEANEKVVNKVYLETIAQNADGFTVQEEQDLFAVANQCPLVGGNAVFRARALYYLVDPEQDFDDPSLCLQHGLITKSVKRPEVHGLNIVPNPAMDEATLLLTEPLNEVGSLVFYSALGEEVLHLRIPAEQQRLPVSTASLAPGMYHYRVYNARGELGDGKLSIVR